MKRHLCAFALLASLVSSSVQAQAPPRFVTYSLAGKNLKSATESDDMTAISDKKKGYYLVRKTYRKSSYSLLLIKPQELKDDPSGMLKQLKVRVGTLPSLSTGQGVSIGDSESAVLRKLGKPTERSSNDDLDTMLFYDYEGGRIYGWSYGSWYRLRKGKVTAIRLDFQKGNELAG